jgi:L-alanine-DL-glutamate epimerase-like enolase superfamily enzyme
VKMLIHWFDLPLRHVFTISRESIHVQKTLIVELQEEGRCGFGEATTNSYYGFTVDNMRQALESVRNLLENQTLDDPVELWEQLHPFLKDNPFVLCALDQAAHDLWGKKQGQPVYRLWGLTDEHLPLSNFTIGIDRIEVMVAKMEEMPGWPIYKIKLGTKEDLEIVRRLRLHTDATFRVDANCGWSVDEAIRNARELKSLGVEFIEQPLPADQWEAAARLKAESVLPIVADESCILPEDVDRCHGHFHGINIKLPKCGGLTPARRMINRARQLEMKVMVGCMTESSVGISAIAQLLPLLDYVDMDGAVLLEKDVASGVTLDKGRCRYADENGTGARLLPNGAN